MKLKCGFVWSQACFIVIFLHISLPPKKDILALKKKKTLKISHYLQEMICEAAVLCLLDFTAGNTTINS
jgi:hypothetical protein